MTIQNFKLQRTIMEILPFLIQTAPLQSCLTTKYRLIVSHICARVTQGVQLLERMLRHTVNLQLSVRHLFVVVYLSPLVTENQLTAAAVAVAVAVVVVIQFNSIQFNSLLFMCRVNSHKVNYRHSTVQIYITT
jgi:hypothetical protein